MVRAFGAYAPTLIIAIRFIMGAAATASTRNPSKLTIITRLIAIKGGVAVGVNVMVGVKVGVNVGDGIKAAVGNAGVGVSAEKMDGKLSSIGI